MNQKKRLNNSKSISKNTKKTFFILIISGIVALFLLTAIVLLAKKSNHKNNQPTDEKESGQSTIQETPPIDDKEDDNCPYLNEQNLITSEDKCKMILNEREELPKWRQIPQDYIIKLWKKGYHWHDILQLWGWEIPELNIPDLKAQRGVGIINTLSYVLGLPCSVIKRLKTMPKEEKEAWRKKMEDDELGSTVKAVFIVRKSPSGGKINLDKKIVGASPYGNTQKYVKKLIEFVLQEENINPQQWEVSLLNCIGAENFENEVDIKSGTVIGKSIGTAYYLGLLSSIHQKPINQAVASTGVISLKETKGKLNNQEINLPKGTAIPISGLKGKIIAATEKGISRFVFSKYNSSPNLLAEKEKASQEWRQSDDYQQLVSKEIKEKIQVHWAENVTELRKLLLGGELS